MKKILAIALSVLMLVSMTACGGSKPAASDGKYTIGIIQLVTHDALDAATNGFMDAVKAELGEANVTFDLQNAAGDSNTCSTIVNAFVSNNVDLIMANATPALQAAAAATADIPILGTSVTEYGVAIETVNENSPAEKAGMKVGDLIIKADGTVVKSVNEINKLKAGHKAGDVMTFNVYRDGEELTIEVKLG